MWISIYYFTMEIVRIQLAKQPGATQEKFRRVKLIKWVAISQAILYCTAMTFVQIYKKEKYDSYKENETLFIVLVCIVKVIKIIVDLKIHYMFL
jgi:hypothetical protein